MQICIHHDSDNKRKVFLVVQSRSNRGGDIKLLQTLLRFPDYTVGLFSEQQGYTRSGASELNMITSISMYKSGPKRMSPRSLFLSNPSHDAGVSLAWFSEAVSL